MRLKYRIKNLLQFIAFAFYPKTTLGVCSVFFIVVIIVLAAAMILVQENSWIYNVIFALTTGTAASFLVTIIVELSANYRNNKLAWQELQDYYKIVVEYEGMKQIHMCHTADQRAEKKARDEFIDSIFKSGIGVEITDEIAEALKDIAVEHEKDIVEATWEQLPKMIPILKHTLDNKKQFLTDDEISELRIIIGDYDQIRHEVREILQMSPMLYDILNSPDEKYLDYPQNVLDNMPDWVRKKIASNEGEKALERLVDSVMEDQFLLTYLMKDYEISLKGIENYHFDSDEEEDEAEITSDSSEECREEEPEIVVESEDDEFDFFETEDPAEHRAYHIEMDAVLNREHIPFVSWHISHCCMEIAGCIDVLEKNILKKPYYGFHLKYDRDAIKQKLDDPLANISYEFEKNRMEELLKRQETN